MKTILLILLPLFVILAIFIYPNATLVIGIMALFISLAFAIYTIFQKHKQTENPRIKITKDISIFILTFLLISFLGGLAGLFTNLYISNLFGTVAGFISTMLVALGIGYLIRKGVSKLET